ncbi:YfbM family protein [Pleionea litopenaei]|uniref:YfbM family protein n=1 Tax=Pleionea litopenaei TaxID=3070815 RepID=A0AA51RWB6_9GAMM|nr:YfbM family protein [Pleionea sp. HL-JVS1]WMS88848.1 YfbM family protein [Pleionea sp. HL-JVS1]
MGMCFVMHSVSDDNGRKVKDNPVLIWQLVAPDDPEIFQDALNESHRVGFFAKLFGKSAPKEAQISDLTFFEGENQYHDLDKAWHGIYYCLNLSELNAEPPFNFILEGGDVIGDIDVGYGPARWLNSDAVAELHQHLSAITNDSLSDNYHPIKMDQLNIYPTIWERDGPDGLEYILEHFNGLKSFINDCANQRYGVVMYFS